MAKQESLPLGWAKADRDNEHIYARDELKTLITSEWFEPEFWQQQNQIVGHSHGRNTTYFLRYNDDEYSLDMVLRHYYRGGLVRHVSRDNFIYTGVKKTRCYKELQMLADMAAMGLPVPKPVAARIVRHRFGLCTNDILIETIHGAKDGYNYLKDNPFSEVLWQDLGATIARFHQHGVYHSDLNIHNVLVDEQQKIYLIDFDNCEFRQPQDKWQKENLSRLLRSLLKEKEKHSTFHFEDKDWQALMTGYQQ